MASLGLSYHGPEIRHIHRAESVLFPTLYATHVTLVRDAANTVNFMDGLYVSLFLSAHGPPSRMKCFPLGNVTIPHWRLLNKWGAARKTALPFFFFALWKNLKCVRLQHPHLTREKDEVQTRVVPQASRITKSRLSHARIFACENSSVYGGISFWRVPVATRHSILYLQ